MGQAKRRGNFDERKAQSRARKQAEWDARLAREKAAQEKWLTENPGKPIPERRTPPLLVAHLAMMALIAGR